MQQTFFSQFVAGEDENTIKPTIDRLRGSGVGAILDYAAEKDIGEPQAATAVPGAGLPQPPTPSVASASSGKFGASTARGYSTGRSGDAAASDAASSPDRYGSRDHHRPGPGVSSSSSSASSALRSEEAELDANLDHSIQGVRTAKDTGGFAAVKMTSISKPELLQSVSVVLHAHRRAFRALRHSGGGPGQPTTGNPYTHLKVTREKFIGHVRSVDASVTEAAAARLFDAFDYCGDGELDYLEWRDGIAVLTLGDAAGQAAAEAATGMTSAQVTRLFNLHGGPEPGMVVDVDALPMLRARWAAVRERATGLAGAAADAKVTIMVDAEQSYLQPAIDTLTVGLQRRFNRPTEGAAAWVEPALMRMAAINGDAPATATFPFCPPGHTAASIQRHGPECSSGQPHAQHPPRGAYPVVYNTYQAYLRDSPSRLSLALARAEREGYLFGAKLVRGAYMVQERQRAVDLGYNDPIQPTKEATHACYDACADSLLLAARQGYAEFMVASHNEESVAKVVRRMAGLGLHPATGGVSFGQLLGMCDHISLSLGAHGYSVHKYVPYGPVQEVLPYLIRRAQENSDVIGGGVAKELHMLAGELRRRFKHKN